MVRSRSDKLCEHVHLVYQYVSMFFSRPQGKSTRCNCRKSEGGTSSYNCMIEVQHVLLGPVEVLDFVSTFYPTRTVSHKHVNVGMFPPTILHTLICCVFCHGKISIGICLKRTGRLHNFHQTRFLFFETTFQILCASGRCAPRKNGVF